MDIGAAFNPVPGQADTGTASSEAMVGPGTTPRRGRAQGALPAAVRCET